MNEPPEESMEDNIPEEELEDQSDSYCQADNEWQWEPLAAHWQ